MNYKSLEQKIIKSYTEGVTLQESEALAAEFLHAMLNITDELKAVDLDSRMRKNGVKTIRAAIYLDIVQKSDKKPTEAQITATLDSDKIVSEEQQAYDEAEVNKNTLDRYYDIFQNAHIFYRGVAKGSFSG